MFAHSNEDVFPVLSRPVAIGLSTGLGSFATVEHNWTAIMNSLRGMPFTFRSSPLRRKAIKEEKARSTYWYLELSLSSSRCDRRPKKL